MDRYRAARPALPVDGAINAPRGCLFVGYCQPGRHHTRVIGARRSHPLSAMNLAFTTL